MKKRSNIILVIAFLDLLLGFYFGVSAIPPQSSENSWKNIIIYDWPLLIYGFIISLPLIWIGILTLRLKASGRRLNIILFSGIILTYLIKFLNKFSIFGLIIILSSIVIIFYLTHDKIKKLFTNHAEKKESE